MRFSSYGTVFRKLLLASGAFLLALVVLGAVALWLLLGTQDGRIWLLQRGLDLGLGDGPIQVSLSEPRSPSLGVWRFGRIVVRRQGADWLELREVQLDWQPDELLQRRVQVNALAVQQLDVYTDAPPLPEQPEAEAAEAGGDLPVVAIETFRLDRFAIHGTEQPLPHFRLAGALRLFESGLPVRVNLSASSLPNEGEPATRLELTSEAQSAERITLTGTLEERPGGWLGRMLRLPRESGIDAGFATRVESTGFGYRVKLRHLELPLLEHQLSAQGEVEFNRSAGQIEIPGLRLSVDGSVHRVHGRLANDQLDLQVVLNDFPLDMVSLWVEQIQTGAVSAKLQVTGTRAAPRITGWAAGSTVYQAEPVAAELMGEFTRAQLNFESLSLNVAGAQIQAKGRLDLAGTESDLAVEAHGLTLDHLSLVNLQAPPDLSARLLTASGIITGHYRDPKVQLNAEVAGRYRQQPFDLRLSGQGNRQQIQLGSAALTMDRAKLQAEGKVALTEGDSDLQISLDRIPVSLMELTDLGVPQELEARLSGRVRVQGNLQSPRARGQLQADGSYAGQVFNLRLSGSGSPQLIQLDEARARVGEATLDVGGRLDLQGQTTDLQVALAQAPLSLLELARIQPPDGLEARLSGRASLSGSLQSPQVVSRLEARGTYTDLPFQLVAHGSLVDRRLDLETLELRLDGATAFAANGYLHPDAYDLQLDIRDLPTQTLTALGWDLVTGDFDGNLRVQGTPDKPAISGTLSYIGELSGLDLATGESARFQLGWHTQIETQNQVLHINSNFLRDRQETGHFELDLPITRYLTWIRDRSQTGPPLAFSANGAIDLAILSLVLDPDIHRINGRAAIRLNASGDLAQPNLEGVFELLDARYENMLTGTLLTDIQLLLRGKGTKITVVEATAGGNGNGQLEANGEVDWWRPRSRDAVALTLRAEGANVINRPDLDGEVSGNLSLMGSFNELWLAGRLSVAPLSANVDAALQSRVPEIEVTEVWSGEESAELEAAGDVLPTVHLDLTVVAEQQAYLRGRGLEAELTGELHLTGTLDEPSYDGEFSIVRGVFEVFGRKFNLEQGQVLFANNALYMRIPGVYEHEDYTIRAELAGTVDDMSLSLRSVPSLPEDEILSLLIFGESAENISPFQALRLATAVQALRGGGGGGFDLVGSTREMLGVDRLSLETASTSSGGTGVSVGVGKYLSDNVYLELRRTPSETQPWQGSIEIELTPRLLLRSSTTGQAQTGAELLWKRDF